MHSIDGIEFRAIYLGKKGARGEEIKEKGYMCPCPYFEV